MNSTEKVELKKAIDLYVWQEGQPKWIWLKEEPLPRYKGSQITKEAILRQLNFGDM